MKAWWPKLHSPLVSASLECPGPPPTEVQQQTYTIIYVAYVYPCAGFLVDYAWFELQILHGLNCSLQNCRL